MNEFSGKIAVVTGGGTGIGRELCRALSREGCCVATCDVVEETMAETKQLCEQASPTGTQFTTFECDVADESQVNQFRDHVCDAFQTDCIHLLINNAGIGGGRSFVAGDRREWERTFNVCWFGVYYGCRAFMPLLLAADSARLVNISSVNGFWASLGPDMPHSAYSSAKFAVKGFTEAMISDLRATAPHVKCSVVMPGHIGTDIAINTGRALGRPSALELTDEAAEAARNVLLERGTQVEDFTPDQIRGWLHQRDMQFRERAPTSADDAAEIILDGIRNDRWRILVGEDAHAMDADIRNDPENAYDKMFMETLHQDFDESA
jgi:NAD(P)-dependent dehydrogenase (short-subunit alcohol dehydrogenase family)